MLSDKMIEWFAKHGIAPHLYAELNSSCKYIPEAGGVRYCITYPYLHNETIVNNKFIDSDGHYILENDSKYLWGFDTEHISELIICDTELSALTLTTCGIPACALPDPDDLHGVDKISFIGKIASSCKDVCFCMAKTQHGVKLEQNTAKVFEEAKCYTVKLPESCTDINQVLVKMGKDAVINVINTKTAMPVHGLHSFSEFTEQILEHYHNGKPPLFSTGLPSLDKFWKMKKGEFVVLTGTPMSGKSAVLEQLMINSIRQYGWSWCVYSPESYPLETYFANLAEKWIAKPFFGPKRMTEDDMAEAIRVLDKHVKVLLLSEDAMSIREILDATLLCVKKYKIDAISIDPWAEVKMDKEDTSESENLYIGRMLSMYRRFIRLNEIVGIMAAHPMKLRRNEQTGEYPIPTPYDISGSSHWRNLADVCLCVDRALDNSSDGLVHVYVQKCKNKYVGKLGDAQIYWDNTTGIFGDTPIRRYENHPFLQ